MSLCYFNYLEILIVLPFMQGHSIFYSPFREVNFLSQQSNDFHNLEEILIRGMEKGIKGDYQGAITDFTQVIRLNVYDAEAYYNRGIAYTKINNYSQAIADFNYALRLDNELAEVYLERAEVCLVLNNQPGAIRDLQTAAKLFKKQGNSFLYQETQKLLRQVQHSPTIKNEKK
ncbi:tetratricopeptide repeat protein [cyanobacterium endosymbiont of Epithemia clementina EcSB]|uniref:tetratricopeptide repeat protein n=1 Tax=cyanobacterium endosymbiont of Epithemia clementina EcSB TaxID=3034674 RepID=UPI0024802D88|nr:tetratricopeptide repeat protein [cyanobacterium endosymbiont of Epithemia clementina EcSB]WGT67897.1 tetratricopeptide repeat protein [cyanobacterium endosymbiont of Epithemia clementina EcSB]